jgi:hypothetical protein
MRDAVPDSLLLAEPKFRGAVHATFNAGLVAAGVAAVGDGRVAFAAERAHLDEVRSALAASSASAVVDRVDWRELDLGTAGGPGRRRNLRVARRVSALARDGGFAATLLASTSGYQQLLALAWRLRFSGDARPMLVVVHDNWGDFVDRRGAGPLERTKRALTKSALRLLQPAALRLAALQRGLVDEARAASRARLPRLDVLPAPLLAPPGERPAAPRPVPGPPGGRRFVLVGVAGKGPSGWFSAAAQRTPSARFALAGSARAGDPLLADPRIEAQRGGERLDPGGYRSALAAADFGVALLDRETYRWRISASALDLLAAGVPGIFNRCAFVERLFAEHGPVGWICDDESAFARLVSRLATADEIAEYGELSRNCLRAAAAHSPERVGERLRRLLLGAGTERPE